MIDLDYLDELMWKNYAGWEQSVLRNIGATVKKIGQMSESELQQINNLVMAKKDFNLVMAELSKTTDIGIDQLVKGYAEAIKNTHQGNEWLYDYRGKEFLKNDKRLLSIVKANARATAGAMDNLTRTSAIGITVNDKFVPMQKGLRDLFGKATLQAQTGAEDFNTSMRYVLNTMGGSGVQVDYGSGVHRRLDTVVRQNVLSGMSQMFSEYNAMIGQELGCDGIEIDYHADCRPEHEFMQGKQYAKGESVTINGEYFLSADEPDPESPEGLSANEALSDYGCRHFETDIILGVSEPAINRSELNALKRSDRKPIEVDGVEKTGYEWTQAMRGLETAYRTLSGQHAALDGAGMNTDVVKTKMASIKKRYKDIEKGTGIKGFSYRLEVKGVDF